MEVAAQRRFVPHDHMIETLAPKRSDQSGDVRVPPRTSWGGQDFVDRHRVETGPNGRPVGPVSIPQQKPRCCVPRKRVAELLGRPGSRGVLGHVDMDDLASFVGKDGEDEQHPTTRRRRDDEEVHRGELTHVIPQEGAPG